MSETLTRRKFLKLIGATVATSVASSGTYVLGSNATEITFWSPSAVENPSMRKAFEAFISNFNKKHPSLTVKLEGVSYDVLREKLTAAVEAGQAPDVAEAGSLGLRHALEGRTINLKDYIQADEEYLDQLTPGAKYIMQAEGGDLWWGVVQRGTTYVSAAARKDILANAGIDTEALTSWADIIHAGKKLTNPDKKQWATALFGVPWDLEQYWSVVKTFYDTPGAHPFLQKTAEGWRSNMLAPRTRAATRFFVDMFQSYGIAHPTSPNLSDEKASTLLGRGEIAMTLPAMGGRRYRLNFPNIYKPGEELIEVWPIPKLTTKLGEEFGDRYPEIVGKSGHVGGHLYGFEQTIVAYKGLEPDVAWTFLREVTSADFLVKLAVAYDQPTGNNIEAMWIETTHPDMQVIGHETARIALQNLEYVTPTGWPIKPTSTIRWDLINENISKAVAGDLTAEEALRKADKEINDILKKEGLYG